MRYRSIDALRGVAVFAVVLCHLPSFDVGNPPAPAFPAWLTHVLEHGRVGVHLFLVISGFCIHLGRARAEPAAFDFVGFWKRRLRRLYPPYAAAVVISLAATFVYYALIGGHLHEGLAASFGQPSTLALVADVVVLALLLQNVWFAGPRVHNIALWTLALEEQLYLLYAPLLWLRRRWGWTWTLTLVVAVTLATRAIGVGTGNHVWLLIGPGRWIEWALGALAVEALVGRVTLPAWTRSFAVFIALFGCAVLSWEWFDAHPGSPAGLVVDLLYGLAFFVLVNAVTSRERDGNFKGPVTSALVALGVVSYSLYLTHIPTMNATRQLAHLGLGAVPVAALRLVVPIVFAIVFHRLIERRFLSRAR